MSRIHDIDPRQFEYFIVTTSNIYQVIDLTEAPGGQEHALESCRFFCGEGIKEYGRFSAAFWEKDSVLYWQCHIDFREPITAVKIVLPPIPEGAVIVGDQRKRVLAEGENSGFYGPDELSPLQAVLVEYPDGSAFFIDLFEIPPRHKPLQIEKEDGRLRLSIVLQELACRWNSAFKSPICSFQKVQKWQEAARKICASLEKNLELVPFEERTDLPSWAKQISLVVNLDGMGYFYEQNHNFMQATERLNELSQLFPPEKTLICMEGFMGRFDHSSASFDPAEELGGEEAFREFMRVAHKLGFRIMVLGNVHGIGSELAGEHPDLMKEAQQRSASGHILGFFRDWNRDGTPEWVVHYISPDDARWRKILIDGIGALVEKYDIDGYFLDQACHFPNDPTHDHYRGLCVLTRELRSRYPKLLVAGELLTDYLLPLTPFATEHPPVPQPDDYYPLKDYIFNRYTRRFMHLLIYSPDNKWGVFPRGVCVKPVSLQNPKSMPEKANIRDYKYDARCFERGIVPTLMLSNWTVDLKSAAVAEIIEFACQYPG